MSYNTLEEAATFFGALKGFEDWAALTASTQQILLDTAQHIIDNSMYWYQPKCEVDQINAFPRYPFCSGIPFEIRSAESEIAFELVDISMKDFVMAPGTMKHLKQFGSLSSRKIPIAGRAGAPQVALISDSVALTAHINTHPIPTTRDDRNQVIMGANDNYVTDTEKSDIHAPESDNQTAATVPTTVPTTSVLRGQDNAQLSLDEINAIFEAQAVNGFNRERPATLASIPEPVERLVSVNVQAEQDYFEFWSGATRYRKTTTQQITVPDATSLYICYFDVDGVLQYTGDATQIQLILTEYAICSIGYWNATRQLWIGFASDEMHGIKMDGYSHWKDHIFIGAMYGGGLGWNGVTVGGTTYTGSESGNIQDEDITNEISTQGTSRTWYKNGTAWDYHDFSIYLAQMGVLNPLFNEITSGVGTQVEAGNNNYILTHRWATNNSYSKIMMIQGQKQYATKKLAQAGALLEISDLFMSGLPLPEFVPISTVILGGNGEVIETEDGGIYLDWRTSVINKATVPTSHINLTNKDTDGHPANVVIYNNATSGLIATTDQAAIDELAARYIDSVAFVDGDLDLGGTLSITHNLETVYPIVAVYNSSGHQVQPTLTSTGGANSIGVQLNAFRPLSGTWHVTIRG